MPVIRLLKTALAAVFLTVTLLSGTAMAVDISVTDHSMVPNPAVAEVGEPITFTNDTGETLRLIDSDERWDSGDLAPGETFQITFNEAGTFEFASQDGSVSGAVEVSEAGTDTDPSTDETEAESEAEAGTDPDTDAEAEVGADADAEADTEAEAEVGADAQGDAEPAPSTLAVTGSSSALLAAAGILLLVLGMALLRRTREV